jgi:transposase InsO family protein
MYTVLVDAHSKWLEIVEMPNTTAEETVKQFRSLIARMGIPEQIISNNGPQFTAELFQNLVKSNGTRHVTGVPYHPATNRLAERLVRSFKHALKADKTDSPPQTKLDRFLLAYQTAPHATTTHSPTQLMFGRNLRTKMDLVKPDIRKTVEDKLMQNINRQYKSFEVGQSVMVRNYRPGSKWVQGEILQKTGPVSYEVSTAAGNLSWRQHRDQLRPGPVRDFYT